MEESSKVQVFNAEWDEEGVFVYQAFKDSIADWALENQQFGGPEFNIQKFFEWIFSKNSKKTSQMCINCIK